MTNAEQTPTVIKLSCCDGTGWTGNPRERCIEHYEALDAVWFAR